MNAEWDGPTKRIAAIVLGVLFIYIIYLSRSVLPFLVIAALVAFLLVPVVSFFNQRLRIPKGLAVLLAYILLFLLLLLIPLILVPALLDAFGDINIDLIAIVRVTLNWLNNTLESYRIVRVFDIVYDLSPAIDPALETLANISPTQFIPSIETIIASIPSTIQFTWGVASNVLGTLISYLLALILTLLFSIYMTVDGGKFIKAFIGLAPKSHRSEFTELYRHIKAIWAAYFRGQFLLVIVIGVFTWIGGTIIGLPGALALGVIAGVLEIIPNLGPIFAAIPALLVALMQGSTTLEVNNFYFMLIVLIMYFLIQQLENNLIVPKILGDAVELHPLVIMVGVIVGAATVGILGALLAAPTIASVRVLVAYTYAKILNEEPFPISAKTAPQGPSFSERFVLVWQKLQEFWAQASKKISSTSEEK
jgi:predicted PurR-regulated permease PerM